MPKYLTIIDVLNRLVDAAMDQPNPTKELQVALGKVNKYWAQQQRNRLTSDDVKRLYEKGG